MRGMLFHCENFFSGGFGGIGRSAKTSSEKKAVQ